MKGVLAQMWEDKYKNELKRLRQQMYQPDLEEEDIMTPESLRSSLGTEELSIH